MKDPNKVDAPWTDKQIQSLNTYQHSGYGHPYTCPLAHSKVIKNYQILVATREGWLCPTALNSQPVQMWAWKDHTNWAWKKEQEKLLQKYPWLTNKNV
jgi:hypothetical protein